MSFLLDLLVSTVTQGLIYGLLACGVYITYRILDFPDLTVDGSFPFGAAVTAVLLSRGFNPSLALLVSALAGALAGFITGVIHVRFRIRDLLSGIISMTALFSVNLKLAGSNLILERDTATIFSSGLTDTLLGSLPLIYRKAIVALVLALIVKIVLDVFFRTKCGLLLRATGNNASVVTTLARDSGAMKILGLTIANALVALSGSVICQEQRAFSSTMGTGQMVFGLAAVIIGVTIFRRLRGVKGTTAAICGSILYKCCIQIAISLGLDANLLNLITAVLFLIILVAGNRKKEAEHA